ncbi:MAG: T9SS type A sorting domain-containing protein, partial [Bacteroidetes bacterium]|nr:T9SS type A sorting domain-containing protein [Bacteroidota bacterium]
WDMLSLAIYEATGANTYALQTDINEAEVEMGDIGFRHSMKFYDANKDGKLEMFAAGITGDGDNPGAVYYMGNVSNVATLDTGSVQAISPFVDGAAHDSWSLEGGDVGDIDGDGKVDYFAVGAGPMHRNLYRLEYKTGAYNDPASYSWDSVYHATFDSTYDFRNVVIADDLDGDGKKEVLLANVKTRNNSSDAAVIILESKVVVVSVQQISDAVPSAFTLGQNYPNPFNPTSTIQFALQTAGQTELFVTNALGQRVASLVNGPLAAGTHQVTFDAGGLASGTYFYTLKSGSKVETKKMMLMK